MSPLLDGLVGTGIDRVLITSPAGDAVLAYIRTQPTEGRRDATT